MSAPSNVRGTSPRISRDSKKFPTSTEQKKSRSRSPNNQNPRESDTVSFASHTDYPGDGICLTVLEFNEVFTTTYQTWNLDSIAFNEDGFKDACIESFLELVRGLPNFTVPPCDNKSVRQTEDELKVECAVRWITTAHTQCDQNEKIIRFGQHLGYAYPARYDIYDTAPAVFLYSGLGLNLGCDFSCLILAWSYVLSCRWVEILQGSGHKAFLRHKSSGVTESTWHLILGSHWEAVLVWDEESFYAPRILLPETAHSKRLFRTFVSFELTH